jgi:hypothetical protein
LTQIGAGEVNIVGNVSADEWRAAIDRSNAERGGARIAPKHAASQVRGPEGCAVQRGIPQVGSAQIRSG